MIQNKKCKLCRREGIKLFLKGDRCSGSKCALIRRPYAPGSNGKNHRPKLSDYAIQLRAKQSAKRIYKINENSLKKYYIKATKSKESTAEKIIQLLQIRLDSVVYILGFADSRNQARQIIKHGHILVNNKKVSIPSYSVKLKDKISVNKNYQSLVKNNKKSADMPIWIKLSKNKTQGEIVKIPDHKDISTDINSELIVEFYSK
jgi:small subunit ribosomal protein S4